MMRRFFLLSLLGLLLVGGLTSIPAANAQTDDDGSQFVGQLPAPPFPDGVEWLNVPGPLTLEALEGKVVLLDFWTYGCINCIHMIPVLEELEHKYAEELVIIGVHSAKFDNEAQTENIRDIIQRYEIVHPVINDADFMTWRTYRVNAWPTFVLIDPRGNILAQQAGEIPFEAFDRVIGGMIDYFDASDEIDRAPIDIDPEGAGDPNTLLRFPGKVLADPDGGRLFIADTNHNRIIITDLTTYEVLAVIGTGARGLDDGAYTTATFNKPQGMALTPDGTTLYVADVNNHTIRAVDLSAETVMTVAGTGEMGRQRAIIGEDITTSPLRSPWDVALDADGRLHVAMAGPHQLWVLDLEAGQIVDVVGNGREAMFNASFEDSELAQPSGLHFDGSRLYFADSESSTIRVADFETRMVDVVSGTTANDLFDFGDVDGGIGTSRLQHPLGVTGTPDGILYIADTYNDRIKRIDPETKVTETVFGVGEDGFADGDGATAQFDEPGGLDYANGRLYVADTNNHVIRVIDLETDTVSTMVFPNPEALQLSDEIVVAGGNLGLTEELALPLQTVAPGAGDIVLQITLPDGYKINEDAPSQVTWSSTGAALNIPDDVATQPLDDTELRVPVTLRAGDDRLEGLVTVYYCEAINETLCFIDEVHVDLPLTVSADASSSELVVERSITPPGNLAVGGLD